MYTGPRSHRGKYLNIDRHKHHSRECHTHSRTHTYTHSIQLILCPSFELKAFSRGNHDHYPWHQSSDNFSSRTAAFHDECADATVGNVIGQSAVLTSSLSSCFTAIKSYYFRHNFYSHFTQHLLFMILKILLCRKLFCMSSHMRVGYSQLLTNTCRYIYTYAGMQAHTCTRTHTLHTH